MLDVRKTVTEKVVFGPG